MASSAVADSFTTREDAKKQKALQEARAAGTAAPETDEFTGKMINPHNPEFITKAPWYLNQDKPSLKHHQAWNAKSMGTRDWYIRGTKGDVKTKFIKGACENCGATTHTKKDCVERPRAITAKQNGKNLMPDEYITELNLDYDGKRDRWNGFQPDDYKQVIEDWERVEAERRRVKAAEMEERAKLKERLKAQKRLLKKKRKQRRRQLRRQAEGKEDDTDTGDSDTGDSDTDTDTDSDSEASDDEDLGEKLKDFDKSTLTVAAKDDKLRTTTRNLRIREDTAKYLLNLDVNSAYYDPKSRSMRQDPLAHLKDEEKGTTFRGDNFLRHSGDSKSLTELMCFAWDSYKHGEKIHDTAQPTQALKMFEVYQNRATDLKEQQQKELMDKYGGQEHMEAPRELIFSQNENYVEYARDGRVLKGSERALTKSKYEEDVLIGNHTSTWGSWFDAATGRWGFACCHQTMKNAYCVPIKKGELEAPAEAEEGVEPPEALADAAGEAGEAGGSLPSSAPVSKLNEMRTSAFGHVLEEAEELDEKKLAEALQQAKKKQKLEKKEGRLPLDDERNRGYGSLAGENLAGEISPEEYEAYRLTRQRADDPMAKFIPSEPNLTDIVDMVAMRSLMVASSVAFALACEDLNGFDEDAYAASLWGGSIGGMVVGVLVIVLMSLPLCCGVLKQYGKVIGAIGIFLGLLALVIPLFGALGSCVPFVDAACNDACTPCTDEEKKIWASACQTLGIVFVYMVVFGWAACVLGIVGASLACCVCCQCCKAKLDDPWVKQGAPPVVVGTAAPA